MSGEQRPNTLHACFISNDFSSKGTFLKRVQKTNLFGLCRATEKKEQREQSLSDYPGHDRGRRSQTKVAFPTFQSASIEAGSTEQREEKQNIYRLSRVTKEEKKSMTLNVPIVRKTVEIQSYRMPNCSKIRFTSLGKPMLSIAPGCSHRQCSGAGTTTSGDRRSL